MAPMGFYSVYRKMILLVNVEPLKGERVKDPRNLSHHAQKLGMIWPKVCTHPDMFCISCGFLKILTIQLLGSHLALKMCF